MAEAAFALGSKETPCKRCGVPCRIGPPPNPEALMLRRAIKPSGVCVNCAVATHLMNIYPLNMTLDEKGPECLRHPSSRAQFAELMAVAISDASPEDIDWDRVIADWDLPITIFRNNPQNPYLPTHPRRSTRGEQYEPERNAWARPPKAKSKPKKHTRGRGTLPSLFD